MAPETIGQPQLLRGLERALSIAAGKWATTRDIQASLDALLLAPCEVVRVTAVATGADIITLAPPANEAWLVLGASALDSTTATTNSSITAKPLAGGSNSILAFAATLAASGILVANPGTAIMLYPNGSLQYVSTNTAGDALDFRAIVKKVQL